MRQKLTEQEAISKTVQHWTRMYYWAKGQPKSRRTDEEEMENAIGESWFGQYCPLCTEYYAKKKGLPDLCSPCLLAIKYGKCSMNVGENLWGTVHGARFWGVWAVRAAAFIEQLRSL